MENIEKPVKGNCIAVLMFAWCYIFSARWVEMQSTSSLSTTILPNMIRLVYLNNQAEWNTEASNDDLKNINVNVGDVSDDVKRWWAAILTPSEG